MSAPVRQLLDMFNALPDPDKQVAAAEIVRRLTVEVDMPAAALDALADTLLAALDSGEEARNTDRLLDAAYHAECEADAGPDVSLDAVRAALAVLPGDLTADFAAERDER